MKGKSILDWLKELPEPYKAKAIRNYYLLSSADIETCPETIEDALKCAFDFSNSEEGFLYWWDFCTSNKDV